uniref:RdRP n=1 Tax=Rhizophora mucronata TaxID=61149 RepID=A0A2P2PND5_RHIMU
MLSSLKRRSQGRWLAKCLSKLMICRTTMCFKKTLTY